jgi:hypothetical protein
VRFALAALLWLCTTAVLSVAVAAVWTQAHVVVDVNCYPAMALQTAFAAELGSRATVLISQQSPLVDSAQVRAAAVGNTTGDSRGIADVMVGHAESSLHDWRRVSGWCFSAC